jgi:fumarylacetoacetase
VSYAGDINDPALESWLPVDGASDFPIQNLPLGVFSRDGAPARIGVAVGDNVLDLRALAETGLLDAAGDRALFCAGELNSLFAAGRGVGGSLRRRLSELLRVDGDPALREGNVDACVTPARDVRMLLPVSIGDYVDFYSSIEHATNLGKLFRPDAEPLLPNWRWIPIGYHGRSATVVVSGTPIVRPSGQRKSPSEARPAFGPSTMLDIELELGFITGAGNAIGVPIPVDDALGHVAGFVLVNDWSARDIQAWEYQPLGPFLGKSFATTISPWVLSPEALEPFAVPSPPQEPLPLPYLAARNAVAYDIRLAVELQTEAMRRRNATPHVISQTTSGSLYWSVAQQLAHATSNGAQTRAGDLFASGTISGTSPDSYGSLIELTWRGERPIELPNGEKRTFLQDGDTIIMRGWCERPGARRIGFGSARGEIVPAVR